jgi:hypothetical protein
MKTSSLTLSVVALALALGACNRPDTDRTTSIPRGVDKMATVQQEPSGMSAPAAPRDLSPVPPNANAAAPGTDAAAALAKEPDLKAGPSPDKITGDAASDQRLAAQAQEAAARAPDTASADEAKKQVMQQSGAPGSSETARDTDANNPRHGASTKQEESTEMPKAGQANNHSSTALEKDSGK